MGELFADYLDGLKPTLKLIPAEKSWLILGSELVIPHKFLEKGVIMKRSTVAMLLILFSSLVGCSSLPKSTNEMWRRSGYGKEEGSLKVPRPSRSRKKKRIEKVWVGRRLLPSGDYFQQGIVHLVLEEPNLIFEDENLKP